MKEKKVKLSIVELGKKFKETRSEKTFKEIYDRLRVGVINYYSTFGKDHQLIEDSYTEAMISIWSHPDKIDTEQYSISTSIYLKTRQNIIKQNKNRARCTGDGNSLVINEDSDNFVQEIEREVLSAGGDVVKISSIQSSFEDEIIEQEKSEIFWKYIKTIKNHDLIYDYYVNEMLYKELAVKYFNDGKEFTDPNKYSSALSTVKNRIRAGKKMLTQKIKEHEETIKSLIKL